MVRLLIEQITIQENIHQLQHMTYDEESAVHNILLYLAMSVTTEAAVHSAVIRHVVGIGDPAVTINRSMEMQ